MSKFTLDEIEVVEAPQKKKKGSAQGPGVPGSGEPGGGGEPDDEEGEGGDEAEDELDRRSGDDHSTHHSDDDEGPDGETPTKEDLEKHGKKVSKAAGEKDEGAKAGKAGDDRPGTKSGPGGPGSHSNLQPHEVDWSKIRPRYNWKDLLARLIRASDSTEITYQKVHRRAVTSMHTAAQTGAGVVRPGEKDFPANLVKLCIVIDSSGSMSSSILTVFANINKLFAESSSGIAKEFAVVEFSGNFHPYACTISGKVGTARAITGVEGMKGAGGGERIDLSVLLSRHEGGGTNFDEALVSCLKGFIKEKYNVLIMTDSDIIAGSNKQNFLDLYASAHQQVYMLQPDKENFTNVVKALKGASANISHM